MENSSKSRLPNAARLAGIALGVLVAAQVFAQYPGSQAKKPAVATTQRLRSTAVLEWIGEPGKPSASRIVPVAVWDGTRYQDGGLYLAQPEPLAVEDGTEYELQHAGVPEGRFVIFHPGQVARNWFGYGVWHPVAPKTVSKLKPSKTPPRVVTETDPDRPSFANKSKGDKGNETPVSDKGTGTAAAGKSTPAPEATADTDPDRPTLHKRGSRDTADNSQTTGSASSDDSKTDARSSEDVDPDRPTLRKRGSPATAGASAASTERDPDRPDLHRGKPAAGDPALSASKLAGMPADLQQMAAISDSARTDDHPFVYHWASPDDAAKMKAALEDLARRAIGGPTATIATAAVTNSVAPSNTATKGRSASARAAAARKAKLQVAPMVLTDEVFNAFELSYSGGATLVLTAHTGESNKGKSVTIIAQPDFYGVPHLLLQSVADDTQLDATPRMRLVDAADTDGDNRAELIFELRGDTDRQFAIYRVAGGHAQQVFMTEPLPLGTTRD